MRVLVSGLLALLGIISQVHSQAMIDTCPRWPPWWWPPPPPWPPWIWPCDIYIVLTCSDTMVDLPVLMNGARNGLGNWFDAITPVLGGPNCGPQVSLCCYGTTAEEQIMPGGGPPNASHISMVGGISRLDLGIECARLSSQVNRRPNTCQCMSLIVSEDPLGFQGADHTDAAREQIALARSEGFCRITLTTVTDNVYGELIQDFADPGFWLNMEDVDFTAFESRTANDTFDVEIWDQLRCCPEVPTTTSTTTTTTTQPPRTGLCDDCLIIEGIGYNYFEGDCRKFVQCFFDNRQPPYVIKWTAPGTFWDKTQVQQHWPDDVICEWDTCTIQGAGFSAYGDERHCAAYWQCADVDGAWRTHKFFCCPDPMNEVWDDDTKECRAILNGPGCEDPCPFVRPTPDPLCYHDVRDDPRFFYDIRDLDAEDQSCDLGMVFDVDKCTCVGARDPFCDPIFHVDFDDGLIQDKSPNKFWIGVNGGVTTEQDSSSSEWYGRFDGNSELFVPGLTNLDLMRDWAFVVRYDAEDNRNEQAALIGSTNCDKKKGSYHVALVPQNGRVEAFVKTGSGGSTGDATATVDAPENGLNRAVYVYHSASGLNITVNGVSSMADIDGTMWRDDSLCGFHIGWGQKLKYFEGRIYEVIVYRDPDCIPPL